MPLLLFVLAIVPAVVGFGLWGRADGVLQQILAAMFMLTSAVLLGASFVADRVQLAGKRVVSEVQALRAALLRLDAERHVREPDRQARALNEVH